MRLDETELAQANAIAVVLGREQETDWVPHLAKMGGGWRGGVELWAGSRAQFLVLVAFNRERIQKASPVAILVIDTDGLPQAIECACELLSDVKCLWIQAIEGEALRIVREGVLRDAVPRGRA